ncbi:hypothetical protein TKK_0010164 [Trichogramma kaykai]
MNRIICYPGERENSHIYFNDGYMYYRESRNERIFRCIMKGRLRRRGKIVSIDEDMNIDDTQSIHHNGHEQDMHFLEKLEF